MIQQEICPWENCQATIRVSCGTRPCPACGGEITVRPDYDAADLVRLIWRALAGRP